MPKNPQIKKGHRQHIHWKPEVQNLIIIFMIHIVYVYILKIKF
jgi:hypothetical protein